MPVTDDAMLTETRTLNARIEELEASMPPLETIPPAVIRARRREGGGLFPPPEHLERARDVTIPSRGGPLTLRVVAPERDATGVFLHVHGGGHVLGSADGQDPLLARIADDTGLCAVSVDYRLAPEHPYPAAPDDCEDAALWLADGGAAELGAPDAFAIGGESAGAHLSVVTLVRLRDRHGLTPFRAANLVFGVYDLTGTPSRRAWGDRRLILTDPLMRWFNTSFLGEMPFRQRFDPDVSPLYADLAGLPPAIFTVGTNDPLLDDTLFMEARWRAAGNRAELHVFAEAPHGFTAFPIAATRAAHEAQTRFLKEALA